MRLLTFYIQNRSTPFIFKVLIQYTYQSLHHHSYNIGNNYYLLYVGGVGGGDGGGIGEVTQDFYWSSIFRIFLGEGIFLKILIEEDRSFAKE